MGNLLASLISSAQTIQVYDRALNVVQTNVSNAQTPGWARQELPFQAKPFDPNWGIIGGVTTGELVDSRSQFAEQAVRDKQQYAGYADERAQDLAQLEPVLSITDKSGVSGAVNDFFDSLTQWSVNPNDSSSRQVVLDSAGTLAQNINQAASGLSEASAQLDSQIQSNVGAINRIAGQLATLNQERRQSSNSAQDPGMDATLNSTLEELSQYVDYTSLTQSDGTVTVLAGGQIPLVIGDRQYALQAQDSGTQAQILDSQGNDITGEINNGSLKALLDTRNNLLPQVQSDLDTFAQTLADQVNATLAQGVDANGAAPAISLFSYQGEAPAATLAVTAITPQQLAAASAAAPGGNDNVLELVKLGSAPQIQGLTFAQFYGSMTALVGREKASADADKQSRDELLTQAQSMRSDLSSVSLDEEAVQMIELQRGYQATAKLLTMLDDLTGVVLDIIQ